MHLVEDDRIHVRAVAAHRDATTATDSSGRTARAPSPTTLDPSSLPPSSLLNPSPQSAMPSRGGRSASLSSLICKAGFVLATLLCVWSIRERYSTRDTSVVNQKFALVFPLYYRAVALLVLGGWCWGLNVQYLDRCNIEYTALFEMEPSGKVHYRTVYSTAAMFSVTLLVNVTLFAHAGNSLPSTYLPILLYVTLLGMVLWPYRPLRDARYRLLGWLHQTVLLSPFTEVTFADVILADLLTSYAKVFADMYGTVCVITNAVDFHFHRRTLIACRGRAHGSMVASLPSWLRMFQCLNCYFRERQVKHLANAIKYGSAFPVLFFSYLNSIAPPSQALRTSWLASLVVNSLFSFYWDVYRDWGLGNPQSIHCFLRDRLIFRKHWYYIAIPVDLFLRFIWSLQLSPHIYMDREFQMFVLEAVEILRRCMWIFFRMEWQYVSQQPVDAEKF
eukprot:TRINITY_DN7681_c0_g1_i1.p1 TRINITY_DN7681_c0_g1~~TRINITY_DN7681_c0_g1_i1.p1  ORF type:complete len:446 (+),score=50.68 TRINITY_DN7681_c0_g1_i1:48-1385(+)